MQAPQHVEATLGGNPPDLHAGKERPSEGFSNLSWRGIQQGDLRSNERSPGPLQAHGVTVWAKEVFGQAAPAAMRF